MKNNETIKMGFWKRLKISIFNVENYDMFAVEKISKALGYFIKLIIIFSLIVSIGLTYKFSQIYTTTTNILKDQIPDFQYSEGKLILNTQHPVIIENEEALLVKIIVDDTEDIEKQNEYKTQIKKYPSAILFLKNNILINLPQQEEILEYSYEEIMKEFAIKEFNKQEVIEYINNINLTSLYIAFYITAAIYIFLIYLIITFMDVVLLSILGYFTSRIVAMKLRYMPIVTIAIYSITLSVLLNSIYIIINMVTGFEIKYFQVMYNVIAYIYIVTAILMIRAEMIKQQVELIKLAEEQKKVKEEIEQKKNEEKEKQDKKKKRKPEEKKKEEKDEDSGVVDGSL